ncbi:MAG TPA: phosphopantothenoylcysteine decarboxylase, partial [Pirellulales bacterium]|nr:phosphopantothenoylcysteine decarboxylase [Pirellulales bacterium]
IAAAALAAGHEAILISGPVEVEYPAAARVIAVVSTEEMLAAAQAEFPRCDGLIGVAAPCDYRPVQIAPHKIAKTGAPLELHLIETPDIVATLGAAKRADQWCVGFALETEDRRFRALVKLEKKSCDLIVSNGPEAMNALENSVEILDRTGAIVAAASGSKEEVARRIFAVIQTRLIANSARAV